MSFKSWHSYWNFNHSIQSKHRYILDEESRNFLDSIMETCKSRERTLNAGSIAWRAQNGHNWRPYYQDDPDTGESIHIDDLPCSYPYERMKPLIDSAIEGRANPKGIPCLYLATDKETAMSEVRPWLGAILSVSRLKIQNDLKIIDFSIGDESNKPIFYFNEPTEEKKVEAVWSYIDKAFSKPITLSDAKADPLAQVKLSA